MTDRREDDFSEIGEHGSVHDEGDMQQQRRLSHNRPASSQITLQDLEKYYDVPLTEVAKKLNISITMLKKLCRKFGINRWPHRQIRSINNTIVALQEQLATCQTEEERIRIQEQIDSMRRKRRLVCRSASCGLNAALRNAIFLARPGELDEEVLFEQGLLPNLQAAMTHKIKADNSQRITTSDTSNFPLNELESAGMGHVNKYRATNRRERAGTAATLPYGPAMVMPNAATAPLAPMPTHFPDGSDYRSMHQQFGGLPGAGPGQYPVGAASLQQQLMQHYNRNPAASLDAFSGAQMAGRPHPLGGLPPASMLPDQPPASMKPGGQMAHGFPGYGGQSSQQLQNEQALLQWQMMQHNTPTASFPSLSMYSQGATGQPSTSQYGQLGQGLSTAAASMPSSEAAGGAGGSTNAGSNVSAGNGGNSGNAGGTGVTGTGASASASASANAGGSGVGSDNQGQYQTLGSNISPTENLKRMYGFSTYDPRAQQQGSSGIAGAASASNAHSQDQQYPEMSGQDYLRSGYRANDSFENLASYAQGLGGGNFLSSQFSDYRGQPQAQPSRNDMAREASEFPGYNITI